MYILQADFGSIGLVQFTSSLRPVLPESTAICQVQGMQSRLWDIPRSIPFRICCGHYQPLPRKCHAPVHAAISSSTGEVGADGGITDPAVPYRFDRGLGWIGIQGEYITGFLSRKQYFTAVG